MRKPMCLETCAQEILRREDTFHQKTRPSLGWRRGLVGWLSMRERAGTSTVAFGRIWTTRYATLSVLYFCLFNV